MSEQSRFRDAETGVEVTQWTNYRGHSHHLYFTNPGWYDSGRKLVFGSDRANRSNLFSLDFETGEITQLTDLEPVPLPHEVEFVRTCVNPVRAEAYLWHGLKLLAVDLNGGGTRTLHEFDPRWCVSMTNASADGKWVYLGSYEDQSDQFAVDLLRGYVGFRETFEARPLSQIVRVSTDTGQAEVVFEEQYWIGHVNTSPVHPNLLTYCHEGPWGEVDNRIWGMDVSTGKTWPIRRCEPGEVVGHEYWHADGERIGYHGFRPDVSAFLGHIRYDDTGAHETDFPGATGHIFSLDHRLIVGDGGKHIRLWRWDGESYEGPRALCAHRSSSHIQQTHPHPRISPNGSYIVFTSDRNGYGQVYTVPIAAFEKLPLLQE